MYSATQTLALKEWKVEFIKMFNHKPLLVSDSRSLLSCCTVIVAEVLRRDNVSMYIVFPVIVIVLSTMLQSQGPILYLVFRPKTSS